MNYTTAIFLINKNIRAVVATYESPDNASRTVFKTLDATIKTGDFVIVPTDTRHKMTICKIVDTDVDVDFDSSTPMAWIIGKVDRTNFDKLTEQEVGAIQTIKSAELQRKREELRDKLFAHHTETLKALPIAAMNGDGEAVEPPTPSPIG